MKKLTIAFMLLGSLAKAQNFKPSDSSWLSKQQPGLNLMHNIDSSGFIFYVDTNEYLISCHKDSIWWENRTDTMRFNFIIGLNAQKVLKVYDVHTVVRHYKEKFSSGSYGYRMSFEPDSLYRYDIDISPKSDLMQVMFGQKENTASWYVFSGGENIKQIKRRFKRRYNIKGSI